MFRVLSIILFGSACAMQPPVNGRSEFEQILRLSQDFALELDCHEECRLIDLRARAIGRDFYIPVSRDCGVPEPADCLVGGDFIQYFDPENERMQWQLSSAQYVRRPSFASLAGEHTRQIDQYRNGEITRSYFVTDDQIYMLIYEGRICAGETALCYSISHFDYLLFEIRR